MKGTSGSGFTNGDGTGKYCIACQFTPSAEEHLFYWPLWTARLTRFGELGKEISAATLA